MKCTDRLKTDHEVILQALNVLTAMAHRMKGGRSVDYEDVRETLNFFIEFADHSHHIREETVLFPAMAQAGIPVQGGPIGMMLLEHEQGRSLIRAMGNSNERADIAEFVRCADQYAELLTDHIQKENYILFDMAEKVLRPEEDQRIIEAFNSFETEVAGQAGHARLRHAVEELASKYVGTAA